MTFDTEILNFKKNPDWVWKQLKILGCFWTPFAFYGISSGSFPLSRMKSILATPGFYSACVYIMLTQVYSCINKREAAFIVNYWKINCLVIELSWDEKATLVAAWQDSFIICSMGSCGQH